ncbi:MAG: hypothetical protein ACMXYE_00180 [Candidatus Woesearchaeota archaeon]
MTQELYEKIREKLRTLTGKKNIYLVERGNKAIWHALNYAHEQGFKEVSIQDQGGWVTYEPYSVRLSLVVNTIPTDYGLFEGDFQDAVLLINSMPGYASYLDTTKITVTNGLIINDVSGSIGTPQGKWGDIIVGSFGRWKPVNAGFGGFIATDKGLNIEEFSFNENGLLTIIQKLEELPKRREFLVSTCAQVKESLKQCTIIHPKHEGIVVIVKGDSHDSAHVLAFCDEFEFPYTICPRYIRITEPGVSIEVKRLDEADREKPTETCEFIKQK